jgi:lipopolysaccharide transport system permease protein
MITELVLAPGRPEKEYWRDLWRYRELLWVLAWRDVSARYKQTAIGVAWALLQPFLTMLVLTIVFGRVAGLPSEGAAPYALMVLAGVLPWQLFATGLGNASQSLVMNANLISKVYFPRVVVPLAAVVTSLVDFLLAFAILLGMFAWYGDWPDARILALPFFVLLAALAVIGPGLLITALNVQYRDFRYVIPFIVQFGLYVSPVGFTSAAVRERVGDALYLVYCLNPMVAVIDGFRWAILRGEATVHWPGFGLSLLTVGLFLWLGVGYFRRTERGFADVI